LKIKLTISSSSETSQKSTDISNRLSETKDMVVNLIIYVKELVASGIHNKNIRAI
jgi:translation initiation factor 2 beta subunit (eIF-2beta)/eIF-5